MQNIFCLLKVFFLVLLSNSSNGYITFKSFCYLLLDRVLLSSETYLITCFVAPGWPQTPNPPISTSWILIDGILCSFFKYKFKSLKGYQKSIYFKCFLNRLSVTVPRSNQLSRLQLWKECMCPSKWTQHGHLHSAARDHTLASQEGTCFFSSAYFGSLHYHLPKSISHPQLSSKSMGSLFKIQPEFDHLH
jgi:hypothetical protein